MGTLVVLQNRSEGDTHRFWWLAQLVLLLLMLRSSVGPAAAQGQWQADPVLSQHLIYKILTDEQGFFWIATDNGIYRYDGYQTVALGALVRQGPPLAAVRYTMVLGRHGDLWLLSEQGLFRYSTTRQKLVAVPLPHRATDLPDVTLQLVADDAHDLLWVSAARHTLVALTLSRGTLVPDSYQQQPADVVWLAPDARGALWVVTGDHTITCLLGKGKPQRYRMPTGKYLLPVLNSHPQQFVSACAQYAARADGRLYEVARWLPADAGNVTEYSPFGPQLQPGNEQWVVGRHLVQLRRVAGRRQLRVTLEPAHFANTAGYIGPLLYQLQRDCFQTEWCFSVAFRGCYKRHQSPYLQAIATEPAQWYSTRGIVRLPSQQLMVSNYMTANLLQAAGQPFAPLLPLPKLKAVYYALLPLALDSLLAGDDNSLFLLNPRTWQAKQVAVAGGLLLRPPVTSLVRGRRGRIWVGANSGLYWLSAAQPWLHPFEKIAHGQMPQAIRAVLQGNVDTLWLAATDGLYQLDVRTGRLQHFGTGAAAHCRLPTNEVLSLQAAGSQVWVGTRDQGLLLIDPRRGVLRHLTTATGLPSNTVCSLLMDAQANLWLGTYAGVVRYRPASGKLAVFTTVNGLADNECNAYSAFRDADGSLYFGGVKGITRFIPQKLNTRFSFRRRLVVSRVARYLGTDTLTHFTHPAQQAVRTLRLTDDDQTTVQVALTDFLSPKSTKYLYQLRGSADTSWHRPFPTRTIRLLKLPVGNYTLIVKAESDSGIPAANILYLPLEVRRTWWKYPVVWAVAGLLVVGGLAAFVQWIRRRHRQQQQQLRGRLAYDLHDELGSLLVRASLQAEVLKRSDAVNVTTATNLLGDLQTASQAMRDVVWGIDPQVNTLGSILDRMREHLALTLPLVRREVSMLLSGLEEDKLVSPALRQHVYAVFKEAVTNSLRHARNSTLLTVSLEQHSQQLILCVRDDGSPVADACRKGMGMRSMSQRAQLLGGQVTAGPLPDGGFQIKLVAPL